MATPPMRFSINVKSWRPAPPSPQHGNRFVGHFRSDAVTGHNQYLQFHPYAFSF